MYAKASWTGRLIDDHTKRDFLPNKNQIRFSYTIQNQTKEKHFFG